MITPSSFRLNAALWVLLALALAGVLTLLSPILTPFLIGSMLAYVCNPLVTRVEQLGAPRALGALLALLLIFAWLALMLLIIVPLLRDEALRILTRMPDAIALYNQSVAPRLSEWFGTQLQLDPQLLQSLATDNWNVVQTILQRIYDSLRIGGLALIGILANVFLVPVVAFYLLIDWQPTLQKLDQLIPRQWYVQAHRMLNDIDTLLAAFLRGQVTVMFALAAYYCLGLSLIGLPSALPVGFITGMLIFIPYIGFASGLMLALSIALLQFGGWSPILLVLLIYGIGQLLESFLLTPYLVGERIGLSPLAVIFALMAFGQIFGFFGVLVALPAAAASVVGIRELKLAYLNSSLYRGDQR
jgi:predicted PurR-regulated permease PerM